MTGFSAKRGFLQAFLGRTFHSHCQDHVHVIDMNLYDTWMDFWGTGDGVGGGGGGSIVHSDGRRIECCVLCRC